MSREIPPSEGQANAVDLGRLPPRVRRLAVGVGEHLQFLKHWAQDPLKVGAIAPSGRALARAMANFVNPHSSAPILELGPGTGVVTRALLDHGVAPERIISIEYNPAFAAKLRQQFHKITVLTGDAYVFEDLLADCRQGGPFDCVISSLPLLTRPLAERGAIIEMGLKHVEVGRPFVQFSYAFASAVPASRVLSVERTRWIWANLPPARVWTYRRLVP